MTADWPLWSALSKAPWTAEEIEKHHYSDEDDPQTVIADDTEGAFQGHGGDMDLSYSPGSIAIIEHMLIAPTQAVCGDTVGEPLRTTIDSLVHGYSPFIFVEGHSQDNEIRDADPLIAAFQLAELSRFKGNGRKDFWGIRESGWNNPKTDDHSLAFAREQWAATHNPLWAQAVVENSADLADIDLIDPALAALRHWPNLPQSVKSRYAWRLAAQKVRLLLADKRLEEAAGVSHLLDAADFAEARREGAHPDVAGAADLIVNAGTRYFLRSEDQASARRWALLAVSAYQHPVANEIKPLLVGSIDELYGPPPLGLDRSNDAAELGPARALLDLLPATDLIALSRRPGVAPDDRRAMVAAAWIRSVAEKRSSDLSAWLPDLRAAFPELSDQVTHVETAQDEAARRHAVVALLLKTPGLVQLPSWARPPGGPRHFSSVDKNRPANVATFDLENPNDGNWWCKPEPDRIRWQAATTLVEWAYSGGDDWKAITYADLQEDEHRAALLAEADRRIALYPLLHSPQSSDLADLAKSGSAVDWLSAETLRWAEEYRKHSGDADEASRLAEALALDVKATRYGCRKGGQNGKWSKAAYDALHSLFPQSDWAAKTRAWFDPH